jgi:high affinity sulfate transporter 1
VRRLFPIAEWLPNYERAWLPSDLIGGLTVTAILIPEGMAYAQLAGLGPEAAFYAAPIGLLLYAVLGTSRQLVVAVSSAIAITSAATITLLARRGGGEYAALTAALALLAGLILVVAGLCRLGRIAQFFSTSVLRGFVFGLALIITMKQIPKLLGIVVPTPDFFTGLWNTIRHLDDTSVVTMCVGVACIVAMAGLQRYVPKLPAALLVLVGSIVASAALDLSSHGVEVVGNLPSGLAAPVLPGVGIDAVPMLFTGALGIALLVFAEATGPAEQFAQEHGYEVDANRELIALGSANMGAGLFQGFPIGASLSKSAANDRAGAKTPMSLVVAAAATALVALFLTPLFKDLPEAALAAIVVVAVSEMERVEPLRRLWRLRRSDFALALVALLGVLVLDILPGLAVAVVASLGMVVWRAGEARIRTTGATEDGPDTTVVDGMVAAPGILVVEPQQLMFFVNASAIRKALLDTFARTDPKPDVVVLDLGLTSDLDVPAIDAITEMAGRLSDDGAHLWLAGLLPPVRNRLQVAGLTEQLGDDHLFNHVASALIAYLALHASKDVAARRQVLTDLLEYVDTRRRHPGLETQGVDALDAVVSQIVDELELLPPDSPAPT